MARRLRLTAGLLVTASLSSFALPPLPLEPGSKVEIAAGTTTAAGRIQGTVIQAAPEGLRLRDASGAESLVPWPVLRTLKPLSPIPVTLVLGAGGGLPAGTRIAGNVKLCTQKGISVATPAGEMYVVLWEHLQDVKAGIALDEAAPTPAAPRPPPAASTAAAPAPAAASPADIPLNPDRWNTLELDQSAMNSLKNTNINYSGGAPDEKLRRSLDVATTLDALFPLADAFSLTLGLGGEWAETDTNIAGAGGGGFTDSDFVNYSVSARWFFEPAGSPLRSAWRNPDRWTSLSLTGSGQATTNYYAGTVSGNTPQESSTASQSLTLGLRLPVADAWTVAASAGASRTDTVTGTANIPGTSTGAVTTSLSASATLRWFLLDRNLITDDSHTNPDMWTMLWLTATGSEALSVRRTLASGAVRNRDTVNTDIGLQAGTRVPISDHLSLSFSADLSYVHSEEPQDAAGDGFLTRVTTLTFAAAVRYFLF